MTARNYITVTVLLLAGLLLHAQQAPVRSSLPYRGGEKLTYAVHYRWGPVNADVANVYLRTDSTTVSSKVVYTTSLSGETKKIYDHLFTVREELSSRYYRDGFRPIKFTRTAREGKYVCTNDYRYNLSSGGKGHVDATVFSSSKGERKIDLPLDGKTYDLPMLLCRMRCLDVPKMTAGKTYPMTFIVDDDVTTLGFVYLGKEQKKVPGLGTFTLRKFAFQVDAGVVFSDDGTGIVAWFSDDDRMVPYYFIAPLRIGKVEGRLVR